MRGYSPTCPTSVLFGIGKCTDCTMWSASCVLRHAYYTGIHSRSLTRIISPQSSQGAWSRHLHDPLVIHEAKPDDVRSRWCDFVLRWFVAVHSYCAVLPLDAVSICRVPVWGYSLAFGWLWSGAFWASGHFFKYIRADCCQYDRVHY